MRLAISRSAAPDFRLSRLRALVRERGLDGVELGEGDLADARAREEASGSIVGIHLASPAAIGSERTARLAATLAAPVISAPRSVAHESLAELDALYARHGARLFVSHASDVTEAALLVEAIARTNASSLSVGWEVDTKRDALGDASAILLATTGALRYIRMRGGGPELADHEGGGIGDLVASIALSGFSGVLTLAPTSDDRLSDWRRWLEGKTEKGCGTAHEKKAARAANDVLDIRPVEPKDRMETILGAYRALAPGRTLHVTFDHDPSCMYYTLQATEPEGSFLFVRKDDGPEAWRADVTKRAV